MKSRPPDSTIAAVTAISLFITVGFARPALAQTPAAYNDPASWDNLRQLKPDQKIQVVQKDLKSWAGAFLSFSDGSITLKAPDGDRTVPRADVSRVSRRGGKRNFLIGAVVGGGAGVAFGAATGRGAFVPTGVVVAILGVGGALAGGAVGAAIPGNTVIYRASAN